MTQNEFLLKHLKSGKSITTLQAHQFGICRLSERIRELEKKGHKIAHNSKTVFSRFGTITGDQGKARVVEYKLEK
jgi:hypothetical protein